MNVILQENEVCWRSPSNIALIKYWGKRELQLPRNPSLSLTLSKSYTETKISYAPKVQKNADLQFEFYFEGEKNTGFESKIASMLTKSKPYLRFLKEYEIKIYSRNSFPHSSGIASSASSMSSLALCLCSMEQKLTSQTFGFDTFEQKATFLARLGSGSASRSVFGGFAVWGKSKEIPGSSDEFAIPLRIDIHENFKNLCDSVLVVSSKAKVLSSSAGHQLMETNPYAHTRYSIARDNLKEFITVLQNGDIEKFILITENEALHLHAMFLTSSPGYILALPDTFEIIQKIRKFRAQTGLFLCFTLDAGPNVHLVYSQSIRNKVYEFIRWELQPLCENGFWIDDEIGNGPNQLF
jgi:diphosphomevalonate decarboxylase